ncbi:MAG: hypothetical protein SXQ77_00030 [Halobacteria archaeon]|nr:hypothetical protein [Halobacteria archaeon]
MRGVRLVGITVKSDDNSFESDIRLDEFKVMFSVSLTGLPPIRTSISGAEWELALTGLIASKESVTSAKTATPVRSRQKRLFIWLKNNS